MEFLRPMRMIPVQPHDTGSNAEQRVFKKFSCSTVMGDNAVCLHSLNIGNHIFQRFGEADFVMICPEGLFVFEVKGGIVSRDANGVWHFRDRHGKDHTTSRGPFVQAREALHSIMDAIEKEFGQGLINRMCIGFGIIMPDSPFGVTGVEWDLRTVLAADSFHRFSAWLAQLTDYWISRDKRSSRKKLSTEEIHRIKAFLRPKIDPKPTFSLEIKGINDRRETLTRTQFHLLDAADSNQRVIFRGGAGTGKGQMAIELSQRFAETGKTVFFLSPCLWLIRSLQARFFNRSITFATFREILMKRPGAPGPKFDILVINGCDNEFSGDSNEEFHKEFNKEAFDRLDRTLKGGISKGRWYLFRDINQYISHNIKQAASQATYEDHGTGLFIHLISFKPAQILLKRNCRHTTPIVHAIKSLTRYNPGEDGTGRGPDVQVVYPDSTPEEALARELNRLVNKEAVPLKEIVILSPVNFKQSSASRLDALSRERIHVLTENSVQRFPLNDKIAYASIYDFTGLESNCVILIDFHPCDLKENALELYLGMGCANAILSLIVSK